jgi:uncharacterized protein (TIGR00299 family) protein
VTTLAWFHCFSGVAGDMALGALLDAGADVDVVRDALARLPVSGWSLDVETTQRCGIRATRAVVTVENQDHHRTFAEIRALVSAANLPEPVSVNSLAVFHALAEVEGRIHDRPAEAVEFHEVGSVDAIVDIVGTCAALHALGVDGVHASRIAVGHGTVRGAHGLLPNPAPAVVALLARRGAPTVGVDLPVELATPTGVALVTMLAGCFGAMPAMTPNAIGYGAGGHDIDGRPNVVQVVIGEAIPASTAEPPGQPVLLLEVNLDDATGETLAHAVSALLGAGAHDAWVTPIVMKKGRPAHTVSALCDPAVGVSMAEVLTHATGSLGVRGTTLERWPRARLESSVDVGGEAVRVKVGAGRVKAEDDDAAAAAARLDLPPREVAARAEAAWRGTHGDPA